MVKRQLSYFCNENWYPNFQILSSQFLVIWWYFYAMPNKHAIIAFTSYLTNILVKLEAWIKKNNFFLLIFLEPGTLPSSRMTLSFGTLCICDINNNLVLYEQFSYWLSRCSDKVFHMILFENRKGVLPIEECFRMTFWDFCN